MQITYSDTKNMGLLIIHILLISSLSKSYQVLGLTDEATTLVIETSQEKYDLNLPFIPGSLLVLITFNDPIRLIDYQSLIKRSSPPNLVLLTFAPFKMISTQMHGYLQPRPSSPIVQKVYILLEPPNPETLQYVLDSKAGYATDATVISVLPGKLKDAWISSLTRWNHSRENYLDRFDASMYFWFSKTSPESEVVVYNYCYPGRGLVITEIPKIMDPASKCNNHVYSCSYSFIRYRVNNLFVHYSVNQWMTGE